MTPEGSPVFTQERKVTHYLDDTQLIKINSGVFGYEGVLPLPPGKYKIEFQLTDDLRHTTFPVTREVVMPSRPAEGLRITEVVPFSEAAANQPASLPFTAAGVRFTPMQEAPRLIAGQDLQFFYQLWEAPRPAEAKEEGNLQVEYAYGRMGLHDTHTLTEEIARNQFDTGGTLINGKKISTADLPMGDYRMAITVSDPVTHERTVATFQFRITDRDPSPPAWDVMDPQVGEDSKTGKREYERALCYLSQKDSDHATTHLRKAFEKEPSDQTRNKLIEVLYSRQAFDDVISLSSHGGVTGASDEETVLQVAESLNRTGQVAKSIELLESAVKVHQSSVLYLGLARYYQVSGNTRKAAEMEQKGKSLATQPTT
jgi:tetratricopeptide (TPR) repeat protein